MLYGKELGDAISAALSENGKTQADAARKLGVKPPSVTGWIKTGRIGKNKLLDLIKWLDKTPLEHWGVQALHGSTSNEALNAFDDWRLKASPRSVAVIDMLKIAAQKNAINDSDWELIEQLTRRLSQDTLIALMPPEVDPAWKDEVDRQIQLAEQRKHNDSQTAAQQRRKAAKG